jgi:hypothetical protein
MAGLCSGDGFVRRELKSKFIYTRFPFCRLTDHGSLPHKTSFATEKFHGDSGAQDSDKIIYINMRFQRFKQLQDLSDVLLSQERKLSKSEDASFVLVRGCILSPR